MQTFIVSPIDEEEISPYNWLIDPNGYYRAYIPGIGREYLHRYIGCLMGLDLTKEIDHINCFKHDCRRENLRNASRHLQGINRLETAKMSSTPRGVDFKAGLAKPYQARIRINKKLVFLGMYATEQEASAAYEAARADRIKELTS